MLWKARGLGGPEHRKFLSADAREPWLSTVGALIVRLKSLDIHPSKSLQNASATLGNPLQVCGNPLKILGIHCKSFKPTEHHGHCVVVVVLVFAAAAAAAAATAACAIS